MSSTLKDVYWMSSPLAIKQRAGFDGNLGKFTIPKAHVDKIRGFLDPKNEYHFFHKLKHWTLEVDGWCYELSPVQKKLDPYKLLTDACEPGCKEAKEWHSFRQEFGIDSERRKVGQTRLTHEEIEARGKCECPAFEYYVLVGKYIWKHFNLGLYVLLVQNCQNFAKMLHESIAISEDDPEVVENEATIWERIPKPVSHDLARLSQGSLASGGISGLTHIGLAAMAPAAEAVVTEAGVGMTATAASTEGAGSIAAAGSTGSQAAASTQTAAAGTSHGTFFGAGKSGVAAKSVAGGGVSTGKVGVGAKLAALSHGATYGAGAGKAAMAAKIGGGVAMLHPVTGMVLVAGLGILALGNRDPKWIKRIKNGKLPDDLSTSDMLEAEQALLEQVETPTELADEVDNELAEEMLEDLELTHITTEPAQMPDQLVAGIANMSVGDDKKRSHTLA